MTFAPDGSPIEVYARLPERGEAELVAAAVPPRSTSAARFLRPARAMHRSRLSSLPIGCRLSASESVDDGLVVGCVDYEVDGRSWAHAFEMRVFGDEADLHSALAEGGFTFERWLDRERGWFAARSERARP